MSLIKLEKLLNKNLKQAGINNRVQASQLIDRFNQILAKAVGARASKKVKILYIKNGTVTIACLSSVVAQEIRLREHKILKELNEPSVQRIRYLV